MDELTRCIVARVRNQVNLGESRGVDIPVVRPDGNAMFEQSARFGSPVHPSAQRHLSIFETTVDLTWTYASELLLNLIINLFNLKPAVERGAEAQLIQPSGLTQKPQLTHRVRLQMA